MLINYFYNPTYLVNAGITQTEDDFNVVEIRTEELYIEHSSGTTIDLRHENMAYFRISAEEITSNSIITINEEII